MRSLAEYALEETLYEGPETCVRRVRHASSGERLVVKLPVADTPSLRTVGRLLHEHQILGKLTAVPGVARARALTQQGGSAALWLEDPGLRPLDRVLAEQGRLPLQAALRVALALCRTLEGVHAAGVVHKDVNPQNILVDASCTQAYLINFGISSELAQEATEASLPEALEGTLAYISPEQTGRTARGLDSRTDLYSLGVTLFEMLSGKRPFVEKDALALVYAHLAKAPPALENLSLGIPGAVARLVERCLEKTPEQRYQTARGLSADLEKCLRLLKAHGQIERFVLGQNDFSPKLQLPQTLVSRELESQAVTAAFERAASGAVEVLLLSGHSGVGKTALVHAVYRDIAKAGRGLLLSGKHDQLGRAVPYAAISQAFSGLMRTLAASPKPVFEAWRARLERSLGPLARVIADLVPELEWLTGPLPAVPVVPTEMAYNRIKLSWIELLRAVTDASPPLVLFLDDMQWVDPASLELLKTLLTDVGRKHLLVIAAFRDNEVEPSHPLWKLIEAVEKSGVLTPRLTIGPLSEASVQEWLSATLSAAPERVRTLSETLYRKTQGNPFFLGQLLLELHRRKGVRRNMEDGTWQWDQDAVERAAVTDNVVELMRSKVVELPEHTQLLLGQASCAGHSFTFAELAVITGLAPSQIVQELRPALLAGLVIPCDGQYREAQALSQAQESSEIEAHYRFLHDRVQQAFYERIAPEQRARTHLQIGRRLQKVLEEQGGSNQKQLEMVRHLNLGAATLSSEAERKELAKLNLSGAKAAKVNGSYRLQATLVEQAQALLGERAWQEEPELSVELALERIEADYMMREFDEVHRRAAELTERPLPTLPRLAAQELRVRACIAGGRYRDGEQLGISALEEQGIRYPENNEACIARTLQLLAECDAWLDQHPEGFGSMPADASLEHLLCDALEASLVSCAGIGSRPALSSVVMARNVKQATERGTLTPAAPFLIGILAHARSAFLGDYRGGVRWAREGEEAAIRLGSPYPECSTFRGTYSLYESPVEQSRAYYQAGVRAATASGSFQGASWGLCGELFYLDLWGGRPLGQVAAKEEAQRSLMVRAGDAFGQHVFALAADYTAFLSASRHQRPTAEQDWLRTSSRSLLAMGDGVTAEFARILEAHLFLSFEEHARALERAEEAERFGPTIFGLCPVTYIPLWRGLSAAKCCTKTLPPEERAPLIATLKHAIERLRYLAAGCVENFGHKLRLLEAELARIEDRTNEALLAYDDAIEQAHAQGFLHIEALAAQFCADFHLDADRKRLGAHYLHQACDAYTRWEAFALVSFLEQKYPTLLVRAASAVLPERTRTATTTGMTSATGGAALDVNTTVRAAQTLASELDAQRVVAELMRLLQENAGAQGAALLLHTDEKLAVSALLSGSQVRVAPAEPLSASHPIASSVVQYVLRSRESLVLNDATADSRFAQDPHLRAASIRSVLAVPLLHQGRLGGILYLEHETVNAFPEARVHLLGVLAAQGAIALENARLYADLQAANIGLEVKVAERTAALDKALKELWSEMDLAQKIQTVLLPSDPRIPGYQLAAVMRPAEQVGGDYYDVFRQGGKDWVLIGDVSGHGVSAGLCMMMIQTALRSTALAWARAKQALTPRRLLGLVNEAIQSNLQQIGRNQYMTITALCIEGGTVRYAGLHQDLLIYRAARQTVERIETQGTWLGVAEGDVSELLDDAELRLEAEDVLLLYTDGYTEARLAGRQLETEGLAQVFAELCRRGLPSAALIEGLLDCLKQAVVHDDITLVALRRLSVPQV